MKRKIYDKNNIFRVDTKPINRHELVWRLLQNARSKSHLHFCRIYRIYEILNKLNLAIFTAFYMSISYRGGFKFEPENDVSLEVFNKKDGRAKEDKHCTQSLTRMHNLQWCNCTNCCIMPSDVENLCCSEVTVKYGIFQQFRENIFGC